MSIQPDSQIVPTDFTPDAFAEWIGGATIAKRSVTIYGKPGLYAEYETLTRDLEIAQADEGDGEMAGSESARIRARLEEIYAEWMASKSTWTVRALTSEELSALGDADEDRGYDELVAPEPPVPPTAPEPPAKNAGETARRAHTVATQRHQAAMDQHTKDRRAHSAAKGAYEAEMNLRGVAEAFDSIEFPDGRTVETITVEQLRTMRATLGDIQIHRLVVAAANAAVEEPVIPAPFSPRSSETPRMS